jgi:hypothetical protein
MPIVKTKHDEKTYKLLVRMRVAEGLPSVSALFLDKCDQLTDEKEAREIVKQALSRGKRRPRGSEFRLRDLFKSDVWSEFSKGARLRAGKIFQSKIALAVDGIRVGKKSGAGHQFYEVA